MGYGIKCLRCVVDVLDHEVFEADSSTCLGDVIKKTGLKVVELHRFTAWHQDIARVLDGGMEGDGKGELFGFFAELRDTG